MSNHPNPVPPFNPPVADQAPIKPTVDAVKPKGLTSIDLNARVAALISTEAPAAVLTKVLTSLRDKEIDKRAAALLGGWELANATRSTLKKLEQPDLPVTTFDFSGKPVGTPGYSKARLADIKKTTEKLAKIEKAIDTATRDTIPAVLATEAVGIEGQEGHVPATKGKPAIEPDFSLLYNLKTDIEKAEKDQAAKADAAE